MFSVYENETERCFARKTVEILIFSDSHGAASRMRQVITAHPDASHILFCGDGLSDLALVEKDLPVRVFLSVKGNCDGMLSFFDTPTERTVTLLGHRIVMMHGHTYGVKGSYGIAAAHAAEEGADILLFGHTHIPYEGWLDVGEKRIQLFNPGSIGKGSYGVLTIRENGCLLSHGQI